MAVNALRKALIVVGLVAALLAPGAARVAARQDHVSALQMVHVVRQGDTLWSVAKTVAPDRDVRETVALLRRSNGLKSANLRPGQPLFLPVP